MLLCPRNHDFGPAQTGEKCPNNSDRRSIVDTCRTSIDSVVRLIYGMDMARRHQRDRKSSKSRKKLIGIVAACIIVAAVVLVISLSGHGSVVTFPDPKLETAIRRALNKPSGPIHPAELAGLANITAPESGIEDLSGLQYCTSLTTVDLWHNQISDISPLGNLTSLTYLDLGDNGISDISPLGNLTNLEHLYLYSNQVSDISPL
ncbi:MAG TPA: leucine-rich repeat domain-containing protein, partial [Dehalococcoidia bacterium]|nr:leucine-rich repeat domain-containing protein [Dehalococcoidia bacterium]